VAVRFLKFIFSGLFFCIIFIAAVYAAIIFLCLYLHSLLPAALGVAIAYTLSIASALFLFCREGSNDYKCAWLAVIAALPVVGAIAYAISCTGIVKVKNEAQSAPSSCRSCKYFKDGTCYLKKLEEITASAKKSVYLEYYIISKGRVWGLLCKQLENALKRGVSVKIIYDGLGSVMRAPVRDFKRLVKQGAEVKVFNKLRPFPISRLNSRNHRKIAVIDGETVFLGGVNIADEYANISSPHGYWKDGGVMLLGGIAARYNEIFLSDFYGKSNLSEDSDGEREETTFPVLAVADAPENKNRCCEELITAKIYSAEKRVCIFTPYLCVSEKLKAALIYAAKRGVSVRIIIPEIPDKRVTFEITLSFAAELSANGVEVYRYVPGFMHAKCVICDDEVLLGSYNFDYRSMRLNYECGIWTGGKLAEEAHADFKDSLIASKRLNEGKISAVRKAVRAALKLFAPLA